MGWVVADFSPIVGDEIHVTELEKHRKNPVQYFVDKSIGFTDEPTIYMVNGTTVHGAVEKYYEEWKNKTIISADAAVDKFISDLKNNPKTAKEAKIVDTLNIHDIRNVTKQLINYHFTGSKVLGSEVKFVMYINQETGELITKRRKDPPPESGKFKKLVGSIDLITAPDAKNPGQLIVSDFKTGQEKDQTELFDAWQRKAYAVAAQALFGTSKDSVKFQYEYVDATGIHVVEFIASPEEIEKLKKEVASEVMAVSSGEYIGKKGTIPPKTHQRDLMGREFAKLHAQGASPARIKQVMISMIGNMYSKEVPAMIKEERFFEVAENYLVEMYDMLSEREEFKSGTSKPDIEGEEAVIHAAKQFDNFFQTKYMRPYAGKFMTVQDLMSTQSMDEVTSNPKVQSAIKKGIKTFMEIGANSVENILLGKAAVTSKEKKLLDIRTVQESFKLLEKKRRDIIPILKEFEKEDPESAKAIKRGIFIRGKTVDLKTMKPREVDIKYNIKQDLTSFEAKFSDKELRNVLTKVQMANLKVVKKIHKEAISKLTAWMISKGKQMSQLVFMSLQTTSPDVNKAELSTVMIELRNTLFNIIDKKYIECKLNAPIIKELSGKPRHGKWNEGVTQEEAVKMIYDFLGDAGKRGELIPVGQNYRTFDQVLVKRLMGSKKYMELFFKQNAPEGVGEPSLTGHLIDISDFAKVLKGSNNPTSLQKIAASLGLDTKNIPKADSAGSPYDAAAISAILEQVLVNYTNTGTPSPESLRNSKIGGNIRYVRDNNGRIDINSIQSAIERGQPLTGQQQVDLSSISATSTSVINKIMPFATSAELVSKPGTNMPEKPITPEMLKYNEFMQKFSDSVKNSIEALSNYSEAHPMVWLVTKKKSVKLGYDKTKGLLLYTVGDYNIMPSSDDLEALTIFLHGLATQEQFKPIFEALEGDKIVEEIISGKDNPEEYGDTSDINEIRLEIGKGKNRRPLGSWR